MAWLQPDYRLIEDYESAMGARGHRDALVINTVWLLFPFFFGPFTAALYAALRGHRLAWVTPALLATYAVAVGCCGYFHLNPGDPNGTFSSRAHRTVAGVAILSLFPCPFFFWLSIRDDEAWRGADAFSLRMQAAGLGALLLLGLPYLHIQAVKGLTEFLYWCVYGVWTFTIALRIFRLSRNDVQAVQSEQG